MLIACWLVPPLGAFCANASCIENAADSDKASNIFPFAII